MGLEGRIVGDAQLPPVVGLGAHRVQGRPEPGLLGVVHGQDNADQGSLRPLPRLLRHLDNADSVGLVDSQPALVVVLDARCRRRRAPGKQSPSNPPREFRGTVLDEHADGPHRLANRSTRAAPGAGGGLALGVCLAQLRGLLAQADLHVEDHRLSGGEAALVVRARRRVRLQIGHPRGEAPDLLHLLDGESVAVMGFVPEPPDLAVVVGDHPWPRIATAAVPHRPPGEERSVEARVADEVVAGEELGPVLRRPDVDPGGIAKVALGRGEDDVIGDRTDVADRSRRIALVQVLQDADAGHQIVATRDRLQDIAHPEVRSQVGAGLGDRVIGDVETAGVDPSVAQPLDQEPVGATHVEHVGRGQLGDDPLRGVAKESEPVVAALVCRFRADWEVVVRVVGGVKECSGRRRGSRRRAVSHLSHRSVDVLPRRSVRQVYGSPCRGSAAGATPRARR